MNHLEGLNERQKEAALHTEGPLLVVAGAGAGKTKTITHRIVNLISKGVAGEEILAVTFTNKAAKEMRERALHELSKVNFNREKESSTPFISTFHSLGVYIIKENAHIFGLSRHFSILDEDDAKSIIKESLKSLGVDPKQYSPGQIKGVISVEKGNFVTLERFREKVRGSFQDLVAKVWHLYEERKKKERALDFDDLLLKSVKLLKENEEIRKKYQAKWKYIHIDEYQDTNEVQYLFSKLLVGEGRNICAVGDADQNIYSWRGANLKNILNFEKDYPNTKIVLLEENYRSTKNILEAANEIIKKNKFRPEKNLFTENKTGEKIVLYEATNESDEAEFVATKILELLDSEENFSSRSLSQRDWRENERLASTPERDSARKEFAKLSNIVVLYRTNFQSRALEEAMINYSIPYQVLGVKFFERKEIKDTLAYVRAALNPDSLSDIKRIINFPARGIGKATIAKIFSGDTDSLPAKTKIKIQNFYDLLGEIREKINELKASEIIKFIIKKSGIEQEMLDQGEEGEERLENTKELVTIALKYDLLPGNLGIEKLLEDAALASDQDSLALNEERKEAQNAVRLMTVHAAKGLEFDYVFVVGLEEGLFPHERMGEKRTEEDSEEERRLFYVALTRAKERLFLSFANFRTIFGTPKINTRSEFISDIPSHLVEREGDARIKTIYI